MRLFIVFLLIQLSPVYAEVYRSVDEHGNVVFSDEPSPGAEQIEVQEVQTIRPLSDGNFEYTPREVKRDKYSKVTITSPTNDQAIRQNEGNVSVSVSLEPRLVYGDQLVLYLDGQEVSSSNGTSFNLENVERGTHNLRVTVKDVAGKILKSSESISFHILRHSSQ